jgi:hypothetical protein
MPEASDRRLGVVFGLLGAVLWIVEAILDLARTVYSVALGHGYAALSPFGEAVLLIVLGLVVALFSAIGRARSNGRNFVVGAVLLAIAIVGWFGLGFGGSLVALLGTVFVLIAGIVFIVAGA